MNNSPRSGDTSGLHTGGTFGMLSQDNLHCILSHVPKDERLFAAMVSTELYHMMRSTFISLVIQPRHFAAEADSRFSVDRPPPPRPVPRFTLFTEPALPQR
jgi:hypothetical protein